MTSQACIKEVLVQDGSLDVNPTLMSFPEKLFEVPPFPTTIKKLVEPRDFRLSRLPPPGYDMRTLRKQVDSLLMEIESCAKAQEEVYFQNQVLWDYLKTLYRRSGENAQRLRDYFHHLYQELISVHRERFSLFQRLKMARNSENVLKLLAEEQQLAKNTRDDEDGLRRESELLLYQSKHENSALEERLKTYLDRLSNSHQELEDLRHIRVEEENEALADHFRVHSKVVLRVAYARFLKSVRLRIRGSKIGHALLTVYLASIKRRTWRSWQEFLKRKVFMKNSIQCRGKEICRVLFARWKVYAALEKHFTNSRRCKLLKISFQSWCQNVAVIHWDKWSTEALIGFERRKLIRRVFWAWKRTCMLLDWCSQRTLRLEQHAVLHFISRIMCAWRACSRKSRQDLQRRSHEVSRVLKLRTHIFLWKDLCQSIWRRRGKNVRKFFYNARRLAVNQRSNRALITRALSSWTGNRVHRTLYKWLRVVRYRQRYSFGKSKQSTLTRYICQLLTCHCKHLVVIYSYFIHGRYRKRSIIRDSFLILCRNTALRKRIELCNFESSRHYLIRILVSGLRALRENARLERQKRFECVEEDLRYAFSKWRLRMDCLRHNNHLMSLLQQFLRRTTRRRCHHAFCALKIGLYMYRNEARALESIQKAAVLRLKRKCFSYFRSRFMSVLIWRAKELRVDVQRAKALVDLKNKDNLALEEERTKLITEIDELKDNLRRRRRDLEIRETDVLEKEKIVLARNREKLELEDKLLQTRQSLEEKTNDLDMLRVLEKQHSDAIEKQRQRMKFIEDEKNHQLTLLREERDCLRSQLADTQEERRAAEKSCRKQLEDDLLQLRNQEAVNESLSQKLRSKETEVEQLEREKSAMRDEIDRVQLRIRELTIQGCAILEEVLIYLITYDFFF